MRFTPFAAGLLAAAALQTPEEVVVRGVSLPAGELARSLAASGGAAPLPWDRPWPAWSDRSEHGFGGEPVWRRWVELVRAERSGSLPRRRAELAVLARLQGRDADAWHHLAACAPEPGWIATLLPLFSPGVPQEELGRPGPLPDGVLLTPALPPSDEARATLRHLAGRRIECNELAVGTARLALSVSVDRDGLEVKLRPLGGGAARVRVSPPLPRGVDPGLVFADWEKLPGHQGPVELALDPTASEHSVWLTFHPPKVRWPEPPAERLVALAPGRAIVLVAPRDHDPRLARFAEALAELLAVPTRLVAAVTPSPTEPEPLVLSFEDPEAAERKLVALMGAAEAFALRSAVR